MEPWTRTRPSTKLSNLAGMCRDPSGWFADRARVVTMLRPACDAVINASAQLPPWSYSQTLQELPPRLGLFVQATSLHLDHTSSSTFVADALF